MRRFMVGSLALFVAGSMLVVGCSDDGGDDGTGGGVTTGTGTGTGTGSGGGTQTGTTTGGGGTGGGTGGCTEITSADFGYLGWNFGWFYGGTPDPALGDATEDMLMLEVYDDTLTGTIDLGSADNADYSTCMHCLVVYEDLPEEGAPARIYFQTSGTLELGTSTPYYIAGAFADVNLVEVTIGDDFVATPVPGGQCLHITTQAFDIQPPAVGWECDPNYYEDGADCDCGCGIADPDCTDPNATLYGCYEGQTCSDVGVCEGIPDDWTCADADWENATCDCLCGVSDVDCAEPTDSSTDCGNGEVCGAGACIPSAWTCTPAYYSAGDGCDCDCGAYDPDCDDPQANVYGCTDPGETGVCLPDGTCETS